MVNALLLAEWAAMEAHKYRGRWVILEAHPDRALEVVEAREEYRVLADVVRDYHAIVYVPASFEVNPYDKPLILRNGTIAPMPHDPDVLRAARDEALEQRDAALAELDRMRADLEEARGQLTITDDEAETPKEEFMRRTELEPIGIPFITDVEADAVVHDEPDPPITKRPDEDLVASVLGPDPDPEPTDEAPKKRGKKS